MDVLVRADSGHRLFRDGGYHWREGCICTKLGKHEQIHALLQPSSTAHDPPVAVGPPIHAAGLNGRLTEKMEGDIRLVTDCPDRPRRFGYGARSAVPVNQPPWRSSAGVLAEQREIARMVHGMAISDPAT